MSRVSDLEMTKSERLDEPYVAVGDRAYLIGTQDGAFPDQGWHVEGEMGGLWAHPIKLLDGFWLRVDGKWLEGASRFTSRAVENEHDFASGDGLAVTRTQFVPDGEAALVVRYRFSSPVDRLLRLRWLARTDFLPVWPIDDQESERSPDSAVYQPERGAWLCRASGHPWYLVAGSTIQRPMGQESGTDLWGPEVTAGRGVSVALDYELSVPAGGESVLEIVIAGSNNGEEMAFETFDRVSHDTGNLRRRKEARYEGMLANSILRVPDPVIEQAWDWVKVDYDWLIRDVPGVGRGLGAGMADYPWWFGCDNTYALLGCLVLGQHEIAISTLDLLRQLSDPETGRVPHEANTRGQVVHPGCTQETPHFVSTVWRAFLWTGDIAFLQRNYEFCCRGLLNWLLGERCRDGDLLPSGYGIIESSGFDLQCIDVAAHTLAALEALAGMAGVMGERGVAGRCRELAVSVRDQLEAAFWMDEEGMYGDILGTPRQMVPRLRTWIRRAAENGRRGGVAELERLLKEAETAPEPDQKRAWLLKNFTVTSPAEMGIAGVSQAERLLDRAEGRDFVGPWGMYASPLGSADMMSINTGTLAEAELRYGRATKGLEYIRRVAETLPAHMPGAISEIAPDRGCFLQAWSGYAIAWPMVTQVFGMQPDVYRRRLVIEPHFPAGWPAASLRNVRAGSNRVDLEWDGRTVHVQSDEEDWTIEVRDPSSTWVR